MDDVGAVPEEMGEELDVGHAGDRMVDAVVESVERVNLVGFDEEVEHAGDSEHEKQAEQNTEPKNNPRDRQGVEVELGRAGQGLDRRIQQGGDRRERGRKQDRSPPSASGTIDDEHVEQWQDAVGWPSPELPQSVGGTRPVIHLRVLPPGTRATARRPAPSAAVQGRV